MRSRITAVVIGFVLIASPSAFAQAQQTPPSTAQEGVPQQSPPSQTTPGSAPGVTPKPITRIHVGGSVQSAKVTHMVQPTYPEDAKKAHVCGTVDLRAIVSKNGSMQEIQYLSGPRLLMRAAMDAVRQWRYTPTLLNGEPVEVDTRISVVFTMNKCAIDSSAHGAAPAQQQSAAPPPSQPDASAAPAAPMDPQLKADILHLLDVTHAREQVAASVRSIFQSMHGQLVATLPATPHREAIVDAYGDKLAALMSTQEYIGVVVQIYAKYFSDADIKAITEFNATPAGQRMNLVMPQLFGDLSRAGQQLAAEHVKEIFHQLCEQYPELQGTANFCPKSDMQKKSELIAPASQLASHTMASRR